MTLGKKLYILTGINIVLSIVIGVVGYNGITNLDPASSPLFKQLSAIRNAMVVDMMHDAFRGDVLRATLISATGDTQFGTHEDILADLKDHSETMTKALEENKELDLGGEIESAISEVNGPLNDYIKGATSIAGVANQDYKAAAKGYPEFQELFSKLEDLLESSSKKIEEVAEQTTREEIKSASFLKQILIVTMALGFIVGVVVSTLLGRSIVGSISSYLKKLNQNSRVVDSQSQFMSKAAGELSASATEQAAAVQETVASVTEMLSMLNQSSDFARQSLAAAESMGEKTQHGNQIINKLSASISSIQMANAQLVEMANIINDISEKTTVINDIVFKTQLLSFNASIEAARAGQHGRGFAVVAEEVGNLADMSGNSAREIQALIETSRKQVSDIVDSVQKRVSEGEQVTAEAISIFNQISKEGSNLSGFIAKINDATREQETGVRQISAAMQQMDSAAQKNNGTSQEASHAASKLSQLSVGLRRAVEGLENDVLGSSHTQSHSVTNEYDTAPVGDDTFEEYDPESPEHRPHTNGHRRDDDYSSELPL